MLEQVKSKIVSLANALLKKVVVVVYIMVQ